MRPDRVTKQDKKLEDDMVNALKKEDFYGKKPKAYIKKTYKTIEEPKRGDYIKKTYKTIKEKPLSEEQRLSGLAKELEKEDFYGTKPRKTTPAEDKRIKEAVENRRSEDIVERIKKNMPMMRYKKK